MIQSTPSLPLQRAVPGMVAAAAFAALQPADSNPTINPGRFPGAFSISAFPDPDIGTVDVVGNSIFFQIISDAANNASLNLRLTGWRKLAVDLWIPETLCEVSATLSLAVGFVGAALLNTERLADAIAQISGPSGMQVKTFADDRPGSVLVDALGCTVLQIQAQTNNANILWTPL